MAPNNTSTPSLDAMLQESRRTKNLQNLAQQMLGSRSRTPSGQQQQQRQPQLSNSLASRAGVAKRPASLPRTNSSPASRPAARTAPSNRSNRPPPRETRVDEYEEDTRTRSQYSQQSARDNVPDSRSNGRAPVREPVVNSFSVRGAARNDPYVVLAENFAPGTTAADIEAVMLDVGGEMLSCKLVGREPVVAEMTFVNRQGAETVIDTFNGKKADGRTLHVYWKGQGSEPSRQLSPDAVGYVVDTEPSAVDPADAMEVDDQTREREEQNRLREERRGAAPRGPASEQQRESRDRGGYPAGPRADRGPYDNRGRYDSRYQNGGGDRYGNGSGRRYDGGGRGRGGYPDGRNYRN